MSRHRLDDGTIVITGGDTTREQAQELAAAYDNPRSYAVEVIADDSGKWCGDAMRYPTFRSADAAGYSLAMGWTLVRQYRVVTSTDPVNADRDGRLL